MVLLPKSLRAKFSDEPKGQVKKIKPSILPEDLFESFRFCLLKIYKNNKVIPETLTVAKLHLACSSSFLNAVLLLTTCKCFLLAIRTPLQNSGILKAFSSPRLWEYEA